MTNTDSENSSPILSRKILAVDYGTKASGLALFSPAQVPYPLPYKRLVYTDDEKLIRDLLRVVKEESVGAVVLGVPRLLDNKETTMTRKILAFGEKLEAALQPLPLYRQDESLSTFEAQERMKSSPRYNFKVDPLQIDALAASIILEDFIKLQSHTS
jgi:putative holliday junction resolvase